MEYFTPGSKISVEPADDEECTLEDVDEKVELSIRESNREMWESELFTDCVIKVLTTNDITLLFLLEDFFFEFTLSLAIERSHKQFFSKALRTITRYYRLETKRLKRTDAYLVNILLFSVLCSIMSL